MDQKARWLTDERAIHYHGDRQRGGDSKARAFADALSRVQNTLLKSTSKVLLRIEPQDVRVVQARESVRKETFLFFFLARERRSYHIELEITVNVSVIDADKVEFATA